MPDPIVAVTFYSKQTLGKPPGYFDGIFNSGNKEDIFRLQKGLFDAATKLGGQPPQLEITLYLIPDAKHGQTHDSMEYIEAKAQMIQHAKNFYGVDVKIIDFVDETMVSEDELDFLQGCQSIGSIADVVKTRTIIDSKGRACLQTDSNVTWANNDYDKLYGLTFAEDTDAFNASRCSEVYVSAHNKLVFTGSSSNLPDIFDQTLVDYCKKYKDDEWQKDPRCNGVYDIVFCEGMAQHGLTYRVRVDDKYSRTGGTFDFYPANLYDERYKLMPMVVPCQRESWRAGMGPLDPVVRELTGQLQIGDSGEKKAAIEVEIAGVKYDFFHFKSLIRVFTNIPSWHTLEGNYQYAEQTKDLFEGAEDARNIFVSKQDTILDMQIFASYYNEVKMRFDQGEFITTENPLQILANLIPDTEAGNNLSMQLFHCSVKELHRDPNKEAFMPASDIVIPGHNKLFETKVEPTFSQRNQKKFVELKKTIRDFRSTEVDDSSKENQLEKEEGRLGPKLK